MQVFTQFHGRARMVALLPVVLILLLSLSLVLTVYTSSSAHAAGTSSSIRHYGPFSSSSPDSGTCGNNWAADTFSRNFSLNTATPNTFTETFNNGHFTTQAGPSPNSCANGGIPNTVGSGVHGHFAGQEVIQVTTGTFNPNARCQPNTCDTTAHFVTTVFGNGAVYGVSSFKFNYYANDRENGSWTDDGSGCDPLVGGCGNFNTTGDITGNRDDADD